MVKIATKFMNVWMYTIRMMEHAIDECELPCEKKGDVLYAEAQKAHCSDSPVRAWDQAVAFYAGSLEGSSGLGEGIMFFGLADNMCSRFLTCGDDADLRFGVSNVNNVAINQFLDGQLHLLGRDCEQARQSKNKIVTIMTVPLVQATLLNAYEQVYGVKHAEAGQAKMAIQGTSYAATVLPLVHDCSPKDAQIIYENLLFGRDENNQTKVPDFVAVKDAFERNYRCMGITCKSVGGIWEGREYFPHASPCQDAIVTESSRSNRHRISIPVAATVAVLAACAMLNNLLRNRKKAADMENRDVQTPEPNFFPHIAEPSRELD